MRASTAPNTNSSCLRPFVVHKIWHDRGWDDYLSWQATGDRRTIRRINSLIQSIERNGYDCIGNPEPLKGNLSGWWSVRINDKDRIVFRIADGRLEIIACKGHYT